MSAFAAHTLCTPEGRAVLRGELEPAGWQIESAELGSTEIWLRRDDVRIQLNVDAQWLSLSMPLDNGAAQSSRARHALLRQCHSQYLAKLCLDAEGNLALRAEAPCENLDAQYLQQLLAALERSSDLHRAQQSGRSLPRFLVPPTTKQARHGMADPAAAAVTVSKEDVLRYFRSVQHEGWVLKQDDLLGKHAWHAVHLAGERNFDAYLCLNPSWAYFQMPLLSQPLRLEPLLSDFDGAPPPASERCALLLDYLLRQNEQIYWARFSLDDEGQVVLLLDMPLSQFELPRFRWAMRTLKDCAQNTAFEIQILANLDKEPALRGFLSEKDALLATRDGV